MHRLNGLYAQAFNRRHRFKGHLFEERYWSTLVETEEPSHLDLHSMREWAGPARAHVVYRSFVLEGLENGTPQPQPKSVTGT